VALPRFVSIRFGERHPEAVGNRNPETVVVGSGIVGACAAYSLGRHGICTTLVDRDAIGSHASGKNPGGLNPLHGPGIPGPMQPLALESFRLHLENRDSIRELSAMNFYAARMPRVHIAMDENDLAQLERVREPYDATPGFTAEWLEPNDVFKVDRRVNPAILQGLLTTGNAAVDAYAYTVAVAKAAVKLGTKIVRSRVRGLEQSGNRVTGVLLDAGRLSCDRVVIATGPWAAETGRWLATPIPVEPVKGELLLVEADGGCLGCSFAWRDAAVYSTGRRGVWLGGTEDRVGLDQATTPTGRTSILDRVSRIFPRMRDRRVLGQIAALRALTPDGFPIIGRARGWDNAWLAVGAGRKGMLLSAGMGRAVADLIATGSTCMSIAPCLPTRWLEPSSAELRI
jgi:glycine oxidase